MKFYKNAREALKYNERKKIFVPQTPCRNDPVQPCVRRSEDGRERFCASECLPHYCGRALTESYVEGQIPHEMVLDENGDTEYFDISDHHGGPKCVRCERYFCQYCDPDVRTEICEVQDRVLF